MTLGWTAGRRAALGLLLVPAMAICGCGGDAAMKAIAEYRQTSGAMATTYEAFAASANTVEEANYINRLVALPGPFDDRAMRAKDLFTPEEVVLRGAAVKALGDYTAALASLEAGGSSARIEADAKTASTSVATLAAAAQATIGKQTGNELVEFAGPVSTAIAAAGSVLKLIEAHRGRVEVKKSILENDAAVEGLFGLIEKESRLLYQRQKSGIGEQRNTLVGAFDDEAKRSGGSGGSPGLVDLGERLKAIQRGMALQARADPRAAIAAFQASHDALITVMKDGGSRKTSLSALIASVESFAAEAGPLKVNVQAFTMNF